MQWRGVRGIGRYSRCVPCARINWCSASIGEQGKLCVSFWWALGFGAGYTDIETLWSETPGNSVSFAVRASRVERWTSGSHCQRRVRSRQKDFNQNPETAVQ